MTSAKGIGIPIKLMHESEGHVITVNCISGILTSVLNGLSAKAQGSSSLNCPNRLFFKMLKGLS